MLPSPTLARPDHLSARIRRPAVAAAVLVALYLVIGLLSGTVAGSFGSGVVAGNSESGGTITLPGGEETPAVLVQCRTSDDGERAKLHEQIRDKVRSVTGMNCLVELVPPRTLPRTSSGKLSRAKARNLYLSGDIQTYAVAA